MDLNYDQFNGNTLIFKYNLDEYGNPISIKVDKEEKQVSVHGTIQLEYVPDEYNRVVMLNEDNAQMTEVFNRDEIKPNTYYIDYNNGVAYLDKSQFGKTKIYNYYKKGLQLIGCSRIYDEHDTMGKNVVMTLQEMIDKGKEAIRILIDLGDAYHIITRLEKDIANGTELATRLENDIEVGTPLQENLHSDIVEAKKWKDQLHQDVTDGKVLQPLLQQTVEDAEDVKVRLDKSIADAQEDIATIEATGNKEIIIQSSQWRLNGDVYEKEITHDLNSENLHVTAKNSNTKEAVTIGYKIVDKTRILLKSDEAINMSVILSASYYHALMTTDVDEGEIVRARKGETSLDVKITKIDEQLDNKALKSEVKVLENRMDSFTSLPEGSTNGDAELMDGRTGADGITYSNIGGAIRGQFSQLNETIDNLYDDTIQQPLNLFNSNDGRIIADKFINASAITTANGYMISHPMYVKAGKTYKYQSPSSSFGNDAKYGYYVNGEITKIQVVSTTDDVALITPPTSGYICVNLTDSIKTVFRFCEASRYPDIIVKNTYPVFKGISSRLCGKKIAYNGDSICETRKDISKNGYNGGAYAHLISQITNSTYFNNAVGGGTLASGTTASHHICETISAMPDDADIICLEGGINDYWLNVPLGEYVRYDYTSDVDTTTLTGALESIFRQAKNKWHDKPIVFIITHKITTTVYQNNTQGYNYIQAHDRILEVCKKYSIPVYDAFEKSGLNGYVDILNKNYLTGGWSGQPDGCHPNRAGYLRFYVPQLIALFESVLPFDL